MNNHYYDSQRGIIPQLYSTQRPEGHAAPGQQPQTQIPLPLFPTYAQNHVFVPYLPQDLPVWPPSSSNPQWQPNPMSAPALPVVPTSRPRPNPEARSGGKYQIALCLWTH